MTAEPTLLGNFARWPLHLWGGGHCELNINDRTAPTQLDDRSNTLELAVSYRTDDLDLKKLR